MYFADLTPYCYGRAIPEEAVLNIGWLSSDHPVPRGETPQGLLEGLSVLIEYRANLCCGSHICELCPPPKTKPSKSWFGLIVEPLPGTTGNGEIRVTSTKGITYVAPVLVLHYVQAHGYLPPKEFVDAVLEAWGPDVVASYRAAQEEAQRRAREEEENYRWAADRGSAEAQFLLGRMLEDGWVCQRNYTEAANQFRRAAEQGYAPAQDKLASCYGGGFGVPRDAVEEERWCRKAAEQGLASAQRRLGGIYASGKVVQKSRAEAVKWYRLAVAQGDPYACQDLGWAYIHGSGVTRDLVKAYALFRLAEELGDWFAGEGLFELLAADMKPDEIVRAQQLACECKRKKYKGCGF